MGVGGLGNGAVWILLQERVKIICRPAALDSVLIRLLLAELRLQLLRGGLGKAVDFSIVELEVVLQAGGLARYLAAARGLAHRKAYPLEHAFNAGLGLLSSCRRYCVYRPLPDFTLPSSAT